MHAKALTSTAGCNEDASAAHPPLPNCLRASARWRGWTSLVITMLFVLRAGDSVKLCWDSAVNYFRESKKTAINRKINRGLFEQAAALNWHYPTCVWLKYVSTLSLRSEGERAIGTQGHHLDGVRPRISSPHAVASRDAQAKEESPLSLRTAQDFCGQDQIANCIQGAQIAVRKATTRNANDEINSNAATRNRKPLLRLDFHHSAERVAWL